MAFVEYRMNGASAGTTVTTGNSGASIAGNGATCTFNASAAAFSAAVGIRVVAASGTSPALRFATAAAANQMRILAEFTPRFAEDPATGNFSPMRIRRSSGVVASLVFDYTTGTKSLKFVDGSNGSLLATLTAPGGGWVAGTQYQVYLDINNSTGATTIKVYSEGRTQIGSTITGTYSYTSSAAIAAVEFGASYASGGNSTQDVGYLAMADGAGAELTGPTGDAVIDVADVLGITDSAASVVASVHTQADSAGVTDTASVSLALARAVTDAVGVTDLPGPQVLDVSLDQDDMVGVADAVARLMAAARTIADAAGITDSVTVILDRAIADDDPIGVTDSAGTALDAGRSAVDAAGVGDQVTVTLVAARAVGDPVGVGDQVTAVLTAAGEALVSDPAGIADEVTVSITSARGLADAAGLTDAVLAILGGATPVDDQVGISDAVGTILVRVRATGDHVAVLDAASAYLTHGELHVAAERTILTLYQDRTIGGTMSRYLIHDPDDRLDYRFDWGVVDYKGQSWLGVDVITNVEVFASDPAVLLSGETIASDGTAVTVFVEGGTLGGKASVTCRITTAAGRKADRTVWLKFRSK